MNLTCIHTSQLYWFTFNSIPAGMLYKDSSLKTNRSYFVVVPTQQWKADGLKGEMHLFCKVFGEKNNSFPPKVNITKSPILSIALSDAAKNWCCLSPLNFLLTHTGSPWIFASNKSEGYNPVCGITTGFSSFLRSRTGTWPWKVLNSQSPL